MAAIDPSDSGRRRLRVAVGAALLIGALVAAWLIHHHVVAPSGGPGPRGARNRARSALETPLIEGPGSMGELFADVMASSTTDDPGGFPPPDGARLIAADTGEVDSQRVDRAEYASTASTDEIRLHYERLMTDRGFRRAGTTRRPDGSTTIVYVSSEMKAIVGLRKPRPDNTIESIVLMVFRPTTRTE